MKKVKFKIETNIDNKTLWLTAKGNLDLLEKVLSVLKENIRLYSKEGLTLGMFFELHQGESRWTVIEDLKQYQKSILPSDWFIVETKDGSILLVDNHRKQELCFYDIETRIFCITDFLKEAV